MCLSVGDHRDPVTATFIPRSNASSSPLRRSSTLKSALFIVLALLWVLGACMLYWSPITRYVVTCERTVDLTCVLEQTRASRTRRTTLPLGNAATAVVRILPRRRSASRVLLDLETPQRSVFAAEFEGADADDAAYAASAKLNAVLRSRSGPERVRITAVPPSVYRIASWSMLVMMGLLIAAGYRETTSPRFRRSS